MRRRVSHERRLFTSITPGQVFWFDDRHVTGYKTMIGQARVRDPVDFGEELSILVAKVTNVPFDRRVVDSYLLTSSLMAWHTKDGDDRDKVVVIC